MDNQTPESGGQSSQTHPLVANDQWAYCLGTSIEQLDGQHSQQANFGMESQFFCTQNEPNCTKDVEEVPCPAPAPRKGSRQKKVSRRGGGFTKDEDNVLCSAFLNVSRDPIIGVNQSQGGYYRRLHEYFNEHKPEGSNRTQVALQNRWATIQRAVNKFCGYKSAIDRRNESGKNEYDRIEDAIKLYEKTEPFQFIHCWKMLCKEPKWCDRQLEFNNQAAGKGVEGTSAENSIPVQSETGNPPDSSSRPEGRDSAKKKRNSGIGDTRSSSAAVEVLQLIHENREKCQEKEDEQMKEILSRKDEKFCLQKELIVIQKNEFELRKHQNEIKKHHFEEDLQLRKQENELIAKQTEAQLLTAEAGIMAVDVDKVAPHLKNYYIGMQRQIMERHGFM